MILEHWRLENTYIVPAAARHTTHTHTRDIPNNVHSLFFRLDRGISHVGMTGRACVTSGNRSETLVSRCPPWCQCSPHSVTYPLELEVELQNSLKQKSQQSRETVWRQVHVGKDTLSKELLKPRSRFAL